MKEQQKLWAGRFSGNIDSLAETFNASIGFDKKLYKYDILGSIAHAKMLGACGFISEKEKEQIVSGLLEVESEIENGTLKFSAALEDIHTHVENRLTEKIGEVGKKLHTARSRNDQVALDLRLYARDEVRNIIELLRQMQISLVELAEKNKDMVIPGFTHLQHAQPVLFAHHLLAYVNMFERDKERFSDSLKRINVLPLGAGAIAGTSLAIDRDFVARELKFEAVCGNSMDAVSDRDFVIEVLSAIAISGMHVSRLCEELVIMMTKEFSFIDIGDEFCTGSSLMPQKKNPDMAELARGKTGRFYGNLITVLTIMKGLPLTYNKDMQEDKEPLFDSVDNLKIVLEVMSNMVKTVTLNEDKITAFLQDEFLMATDMVEYLVKKGEPFRQAHHIIGKLVGICLKENKKLSAIELKILQEYSALFEEDIYSIIDYKQSVNGKVSFGSTGRAEVLKSIVEFKKKLGL